MPSPLLPILAQEPPPKPAVTDTREFSLFEPPTRIFNHDFQHAPIVAVPILLGGLALISVLVERVSAFLVKRLTARTKTTVDDAFVAGLPSILRTTLVFVALSIVVQGLVHDPERLDTWRRIVRATAVVFVGVVATRVAIRMVEAWVHDRPQMVPVGPGIRLGLKVVVIPVLVVTVLQIFGVEVAAFLTVLGVGSLAVALALQDVLKNIFAGIQLVLDQPIRPGDFVSIDDGKVRGIVLEVGLRSAKLRTVDNNIVIMPNATLAGAVITNMDLADPSQVHVASLGVAYGSDSRQVQKVLQEEAALVVAECEGFVQEPPRVNFVGFGQSSLDFTVVVRVGRIGARMDCASELNHRLLARLNAEGIEIPFPTRTVLMRQDVAAKS